MKAIDELRDHMKLMYDQGLAMMAMSTVKSHLNEIERELEEGYVELPKDANDEVFRVGCEVKPVKRNTELAYTVYGMTYGKDGWKIYVSGDRHAIEREPSFFEVCEPPTVEDVLREFAKSIAETLGGDEFLLWDDDEMYAEFAERLQLKERHDG